MPDFFLIAGLPAKNTFQKTLQFSMNTGKIHAGLSYWRRNGDL
jgi:hypothetical protein